MILSFYYFFVLDVVLIAGLEAFSYSDDENEVLTNFSIWYIINLFLSHKDWES